jgi:hypothetical protein
MYPGIELRLYRYVSVLAEELNFTQAAVRLHVSQPTLSSKRQPETVFSSSCGFRVRLTNEGSDAPQLKKFDRACVKLRVPFGPPRT